jgi:hypothetical protein
VEYSLGLRVVRIKVVNDEASNRGPSVAELLSKSSEFNSKLYHISSLSLVYLLEYSLSKESGGEESSN